MCCGQLWRMARGRALHMARTALHAVSNPALRPVAPATAPCRSGARNYQEWFDFIGLVGGWRGRPLWGRWHWWACAAAGAGAGAAAATHLH